ncbi:low molecular weight phosphatase family protein [Methylomonas sp. EFPC3]|uniref:arsenate-mycothiol transferase ArsC n=1 Tax=Methylomonas sp. EFPC3 TaxID=3021710 RepID=UPI00241743A8|nr:low molecular weight phosphatase family protein [Methylomonas sp. EFPC3]WFP49776.1 low molecular weight phosphatase family protein [Methylomonas sp. EFPC3]
MSISPHNVLFLCTGNYYRSRFAEYLFNHHAPAYRLPWRADSRGLAIELLERDAGPISPHTLRGLALRRIPAEPVRPPLAVGEPDLQRARLIVALKRSEHQPMLLQRFPEWVERVEYWQVDDIGDSHPDQALPQIEAAVLGLLQRLADAGR